MQKEMCAQGNVDFNMLWELTSYNLIFTKIYWYDLKTYIYTLIN